MVERFVNSIINQLEQENFVEDGMRAHYEYALITMIEKIITLGTIIVVSLFSNHFVETIIFLLFFFTLRKRTGGFHADKFWKCYIGTVATVLCLNSVGTYLEKYLGILIILVVISGIIIFLIGTVNHPNMNMTCIELRESKRTARYLIVMEIMIYCTLIIIKINEIYIVYASFGIIMCAFLLCLAKLLKQEVRDS